MTPLLVRDPTGHAERVVIQAELLEDVWVKPAGERESVKLARQSIVLVDEAALWPKAGDGAG